MDGHWEWSDSGGGDTGDTADTADLGGDGGHELAGDFHTDFGGEFTDGNPGGEHLGTDFTHGGGDHLGHGGGDDLEEPLGTEHAADDYDQSLHDGSHDGSHDGDGHADFVSAEDAHDGHGETSADHQADDHRTEDHADSTDTADTADTADSTDTADTADSGAGDTHEATFGTDPDVDASGDDPAWHDAPFPDELHLENPPEPVDGFPWTDVDVLGGADHSLSAAYDPAAAHTHAEPGDLASYAGEDLPAGGDPWSLLLGSEDPATSSLATFWAPQS